MKQKLAVVLLVLLLIVQTVVAAENAATVKLIREVAIREQDLNQRTAEYQAELRAAGSTQTVTARDIVDILINDELVMQGAERDGFLVTGTALDQLYNSQRASVEQQVGQKLTDSEFAQLVMANFGLTLAEFRQSLSESATIDNYVRTKYGALLGDYSEVTDEEIREFFRANRSQFMNPELVRISHIFMPQSETNAAATRTEMEKLARWIKYNTYTFEELVPKYSQDTASIVKGGDIGWLAYDDLDTRELLGASFFEAVFALGVGKPSGVLESNSGYHIVKVITHIEPKLLGINDPINPESTLTVYNYIEQRLLNQRQQEAYLKAINKLVEDLRAQATIEIFIN